MKKNIEVLTQQKLKNFLEYDTETGVFKWLVDKSWGSKTGKIAGSTVTRGYKVIEIDYKKYKAHRLAWLYVYGEFPTGRQKYIDHIDGDTSNNRISNLRICNSSENQRNRSTSNNNTSGYKGVSWHKVTGKYQANIKSAITGKIEYLGLYLTPEEASKVYQLKAIEYSGVFYPDKLLK